jgi:hypothetical protein
MDLLEKYLGGDTGQVYEEIEDMGPAGLEGNNLKKVSAVLTETMNRVAFNLDLIYSALVKEKYCFKRSPRHDFEFPLLKPRWGTQFRIYSLDRSVKKFGYVPLSLKMFYKIVGSCNFSWDYQANDKIPWEGADPIQICPLTDLLQEAKQIEPDDDDPVGLPVSADHYHKDNISGGPAYSVELTARPQVDSLFLYEEHETTFVNYLRIAMQNFGFSRAYAINELPDFLNYCKKVKPLLKPI